MGLPSEAKVIYIIVGNMTLAKEECRLCVSIYVFIYLLAYFLIILFLESAPESRREAEGERES